MRLGREKWLVGLMVAMALSLGALAQAQGGPDWAPPPDRGQGEAEQPLPSSPPPVLALAASRVITYTYDANGRLAGVDYGEGKAITYRYDNAGNLVQQQVGGAAATLTPTAGRTFLPALLKQFGGAW